MINEIKQALKNSNSPYIVSKSTGDLLDGNGNTVADFIYHDEDAQLIANAPEWLRYLIGEVERKDIEWNLRYGKMQDKAVEFEKRVEELQKALKQSDISKYKFRCSSCGHFTTRYSNSCRGCGKEGYYSGSFSKEALSEWYDREFEIKGVSQ